jgi:hypothetical protein
MIGLSSLVIFAVMPRISLSFSTSPEFVLSRVEISYHGAIHLMVQRHCEHGAVVFHRLGIIDAAGLG